MRAIVLFLASLYAAGAVGGAPPVESQEISFLISAVESLQGASFIRNGTSYDAPSAAEHLRLKLTKAGSRVKTAEDFIRLCASRSTVSGKPYEIRFDDGRTVSTEAFLGGKLAEFRKTHGIARSPE